MNNSLFDQLFSITTSAPPVTTFQQDTSPLFKLVVTSLTRKMPEFSITSSSPSQDVNQIETEQSDSSEPSFSDLLFSNVSVGGEDGSNGVHIERAVNLLGQIEFDQLADKNVTNSQNSSDTASLPRTGRSQKIIQTKLDLQKKLHNLSRPINSDRIPGNKIFRKEKDGKIIIRRLKGEETS